MFNLSSLNLKFENPNLILLSIPIIILLFFLLRKKFINERNTIIKKRGLKILTFLFRSLFVIFLFLALSIPYIEKSETNQTISKIKILVDNSESMKLYNLEPIINELEKINDTISTEIIYLDMKENTNLGNSLLNNIKPEENIVLLTDGQNNYGLSLEDLALFSNNINTKLFALKLKQDYNDFKVYIEGPDKVVSNAENTFNIKVDSVDKEKLIDDKKLPLLKVYLDNNLVYEGKTKNYELKKSFSEGSHIIKAEILFNNEQEKKENKNSLDKNDVFKKNNVFYKAINVYEKPKVLMISDNKDFEKLFTELYNVEIKNKLPEKFEDYKKYYAIILNNINSNRLTENDIYNLEQFIFDGNGLFVIGGKDSYDFGDYNKSLLMNLLPVSVGKASKKKDITNIVILFDTGVSAVEEISPGITEFDVQKSMTADLIKSISNTNKVAVIEANYYLNTISGLSELGPKKSELINEIGLLKPRGISELRYAYQNAYDLLRLTKGSKNIVIITDGLFRDEKFIERNKFALDQEVTLRLAEKAAQDNIKTFVIGVGQKADEQYLKALKEAGNGEYFKINEKSKIKLYFGDPNENTDELSIFVYDSNHFITKDIKDIGKIYGFNYAYPKENSRLLLTTSKGDPILVVWNYGLGRVASLLTEETWANDLLKAEGSKVLVKTLNWLIEDPERKNSIIINVPEIRAKEDKEITIKTTEKINLDSLNKNDLKGTDKAEDNVNEDLQINFYQEKKDLYKANFYSNKTGIFQILDNKFAVNYEREYLNLGFNENIEKALLITGGSFIDINQINDEEKNEQENTNENTNENVTKKIIDKIKTEGIIETTKRIKLEYIFIFIAIIIFLIELFFRRLFEIKYSRNIN